MELIEGLESLRRRPVPGGRAPARRCHRQPSGRAGYTRAWATKGAVPLDLVLNHPCSGRPVAATSPVEGSAWLGALCPDSVEREAIALGQRRPGALLLAGGRSPHHDTTQAAVRAWRQAQWDSGW